jgi:hypothetical protein
MLGRAYANYTRNGNAVEYDKLQGAGKFIRKHKISIDELQLHRTFMSHIIDSRDYLRNDVNVLPSLSEWLTRIVSQRAYSELPDIYFEHSHYGYTCSHWRCKSSYGVNKRH